MKKIYLILVPMFFYSTLILNAQTKVDTLTNQKIIQFTKIGLDASIILNKIKLSKCNFFKVTNDVDLKNLKDNGVATEVIIEMMNQDAQKQEIVANYKDPKDPRTLQPLGIYYYDPTDSIQPLTKLFPTVASGIKSGGGSYSVSGFSFGGGGTESIISGLKSHTQLQESNPTFYFYFDVNADKNSENWQFATAISPNEFALVKLDEKKDHRVLVLEKSSTVMGSSSRTTGIPEKEKVQFNIISISDGIFKITFNQPLKAGEYCFVYASSVPNMFSNNKIFDFGISITK